MIRTSFIALVLASAATAALAQDPHIGHTMPAAPKPPAARKPAPAPAPRPVANPHAGHVTPAPAKAKPPARPAAPARAAPPAQPASADPHAGHASPTPAPAPDAHAGHTMPPAAADTHAGHAMPDQAAQPASADPHAGHTMTPAAAADPHAGHNMGAAGGQQTGADLVVGNAPAPAPIADSAADRVYSPPAMARARDILEGEHGRARIAKFQADRLEWSPDAGSFSWEVEGWWGGDINRMAFKTEGEGQEGERAEAAEVQLLYSRAVSRYTDVQVGLRHDVEPRSRAYLVLGAEAMFPYWFEAEGALFLSDDGDILGRLEGSYDFRLTQRLILQPRAELEFAAQAIPEMETGSGLYSGELGLRLRYELRREFAPYVGVSYERSFGRTADFARAAGEDVDDVRLLVGLRSWF